MAKWEYLLEYPIVSDWVMNYQVSTKKRYLSLLDWFCNRCGLNPSKLLEQDPKEVRTKLMREVRELEQKGNHGKAYALRATIGSFFTYHEKDLNFRKRVDKVHKVPKRIQRQHIPTKSEIYEMVNLCSNYRDQSLILTMFQSGLRVSALCNLRFYMVKDVLKDNPPIPFPLKITPDIDTKIIAYEIPYYYTFLSFEAVESLKQYLRWRKDQGQELKLDDWVFISFANATKKPTKRRYVRKNVWSLVKRLAERIGLNPDTVWPHCFRKSFRTLIGNSGVPFEICEMMMGHKLHGSAHAYADYSLDRLTKFYKMVNWGREGLSRINSLEKTIEEQQAIIKELQSEKKDIWLELEEMQRDLARVTEIVEKMEKRKRD